MKTVWGFGGLLLSLSLGCSGSEAMGENVETEREELLKLTYRTEPIPVPQDVVASNADDINDRGQVVGSVSSPEGYDAFLWSARAGFTRLARLPNATIMTAVAINERGTIVGTAHLPEGVLRPVLWTAPAQVQDLGSSGRYVFVGPDSSWSRDAASAADINDRGHVVGSTSSAEFPEEAFVWSAQDGMKPLGTLGGQYSTAVAINAWDEVVGTSSRSDGTSHAFYWANGQMLDLGALGGVYSDAVAINDLGIVTGTYVTAGSETRVYQWSRARGAVDIGPTYATAVDGITSLSTGVNILGQVVGGIQPPGKALRAAVRQPLTGKWQELTPGSPYDSFALAVNNRGAIVGRASVSTDFEPPSRAVMWIPLLSFSVNHQE